MKSIQKIMEEITQLTYNIEINYPELYQFLNENPETIPSTDHPEIDEKTLQNHLDSLKQVLKHYIKTNKVK
ncbi:hypothetical protein [Tenacibaculum sp. IB213877]|uniref:hypothetical protein n=1 Tax=Tenacibaculum sp. IB213877 TaxID=3097351 RepID=UPI002A5A9A76|nr:hypothetical protein [Tenacibaculum sp. IB213877]MDY0780880.1 hypothetical protein [Tenacibaculum sp. IB213877]